MSDPIEILLDLNRTVYGLYRKEEDPERKEAIRRRYEQLSRLLTRASALTFSQNDPAFADALEQLKKTNRKLKKVKKKIPKTPEDYSLFIELMENVDKLVTAVFPKFREG